MKRLLVTIPDMLLIRIKKIIPENKIQDFIMQLLEEEVACHEMLTYQSAANAANSEYKNRELTIREDNSDWDVILKDGLGKIIRKVKISYSNFH